MINRKTLFGVMATIAATSVFSKTYPVELECLLNENREEEVIPLIKEQEMFTYDLLNTFTIINFDKNFKPDNYLKYHDSCSKELSPKAHGQFSVGYYIDYAFLYNDPSNMTNYLQANSRLFKDKFNLLFQRSIDGFLQYDQFKSDVNKSVIYITTSGTNVTNISKASTDKYLTLYSETGDNQIFRSKEQLPKNSEQTVEIIADGIISTQKFKLDKGNADTLAQFIVTTAHQGSFVGMINRMLDTYDLKFIYDQKSMDVSYEILSVNKGVVNLKVMTMAKALTLVSPTDPRQKIDFTKEPVTINIAMDVTIYPDSTAMVVKIPFKDVKMDISPTPRYPEKKPYDVVQMYLKSSLMNGLQQHEGSANYAKYSIHNSKEIKINILN